MASAGQALAIFMPLQNIAGQYLGVAWPAPRPSLANTPAFALGEISDIDCPRFFCRQPQRADNLVALASNKNLRSAQGKQHPLLAGFRRPWSTAMFLRQIIGHRSVQYGQSGSVGSGGKLKSEAILISRHRILPASGPFQPSLFGQRFPYGGGKLIGGLNSDDRRLLAGTHRPAADP